jgi:hypothetical protein
VADCELLHAGLLDEPANAVSSLAYVAAGLWVARHHRGRGAALIATGAGSFAYHGFGGTVAHVLHDGSIAVVAVLVALALPHAVAAWRGRPVVHGAVPLGAVALAVPLQLFGRTGGALCRPESLLQAHAGWHVLTAVALGAVFVLASARPRAREPAIARR